MQPTSELCPSITIFVDFVATKITVISFHFFCSLNKQNLLCLLFQAKYVAECMDEIKQELRQDNLAVKANAISKLTYVCLIQDFPRQSKVKTCASIIHGAVGI